jgi:hypothetical protein
MKSFCYYLKICADARENLPKGIVGLKYCRERLSFERNKYTRNKDTRNL